MASHRSNDDARNDQPDAARIRIVQDLHRTLCTTPETLSVARQEPETSLAIAEARIAWALDHPHVSAWLKTTLRSTCGLDPIAVQNDIELLRHLICGRAQSEIEMALSQVETLIDRQSA